MKKIFIIIVTLLVINQLANATTRYANSASAGGGDGTTRALSGANAAFNSITEINTHSSGDIIYFARGSVFRGGPLLPKSGIDNGNRTSFLVDPETIGAKPLIIGSTSKNSAVNWTDMGGNNWRTATGSFTTDVGNLIFGNEESCGVKKLLAADLAVQGDFFYDSVNQRIQLYSVGNPVTGHYGTIECAYEPGTRHGMVNIAQKSYITIDGLDFRYGGVHGISITDNNPTTGADEAIAVNCVTISNCDFSYIGGCDKNGSVRYGNAIQFWETASNILIEKNYIHDIFETGISPQGSTSGGTVNIIIRNNIIKNCEYSYEFWCAGTSDKIYFVNNTCIDAGYSWGSQQRWSAGAYVGTNANARHVKLSALAGAHTDIHIDNNIFYRSYWRLVTTYDDTDMNGIDTWDYNCYYPYNYVGDSITFGRVTHTTAANYTTLSSWANHFSQDSHSLSQDPLFENASSDFRIKLLSPCKDSGVTMASALKDYIDNPRPHGPGYDMGAYEWTLEPAPYPGADKRCYKSYKTFRHNDITFVNDEYSNYSI